MHHFWNTWARRRRVKAASGGHRQFRPAIVLALALTVVPAWSAPSAAAEGEAPMLLGLATDDFREDLPDFAREAGRPADILQLFWSLESDFPQPWAPALLEEVHDLGSTPYIEITTPDFDGFEAGAYDDRLEGLVANVKQWMDGGAGRNVLIAPFPEANLGQFSWGNDPQGYKRGFMKVRQAFLDAGVGLDRARFVFALNGPGSDVYGYDAFYPGDDVVDLIGFSKLNRGDPWRDYEITFGIHIEEMQQLIGTSKPIIITQTGSVESGGDRPAWLQDMFEGLAADPQVIGAVYFNRLKTEGGVERDYRVLRNGSLDPTFESGWDSWASNIGTEWLFDGGLDAWVEARDGQASTETPFEDVGGSTFVDDIAWLAARGITSGCNPPENTLFCPNDPVTRGQMAAFLVRGLGLTERGRDFVDDDTSVFEADIEKLAASGITSGCNPPANDRFCPGDLVTRGQMAAFLVRAQDLTERGRDFVDDDGSVFEADIERLAAAGITEGCNPPVNDRFCPNDPVTRGQMAAFLHRALG